jgi:RimJ/RimL family protein N-acetyltransferase
MMNMKVVIETPRLILREFVPHDADALARVISDPQTMRFYPAPFDRAGAEDWITATFVATRETATACGRWT